MRITVNTMCMLQEFSIQILEKLNRLVTELLRSLITSKTLEFFESVSFLLVESGTVLAAAWMASHKANFDVNCRPFGINVPFDDCPNVFNWK